VAPGSKQKTEKTKTHVKIETVLAK